MYAVTTYLYLRAAEARALEWGDVDFDQGVVLIHRTEDDEGKVDSTKGDRARRFPIEPTLLPLLRAMRARAGGRGGSCPGCRWRSTSRRCCGGISPKRA